MTVERDLAVLETRFGAVEEALPQIRDTLADLTGKVQDGQEFRARAEERHLAHEQAQRTAGERLREDLGAMRASIEGLREDFDELRDDVQELKAVAAADPSMWNRLRTPGAAIGGGGLAVAILKAVEAWLGGGGASQ